MGELTRCLVDMLNQQGSLDDADALASALDSSGFPLASLILKEGQRRPPGGTFMAGVSEFYISPDRLQTDALLEAISERYFIPIDKLEETFLDLRRGFLLHTHVPSLGTEPDTEQHIHMVVSSLLIGGSLTAGVCNVEGAKLLSSTLGSNDRLQELQALLNGESEAVRDFLESVCMAVDPFPALQAVTTVGFATIGVSSWEGTSWELEFLLEMAPPGGVEERQKIRRGESTSHYELLFPSDGSSVQNLIAQFPEIKKRLWDAADSLVASDFAHFGLQCSADFNKLWAAIFETDLYYLINRLEGLNIVRCGEGLPVSRCTSKEQPEDFWKALAPSFCLSGENEKDYLRRVTRLASVFLAFSFSANLRGDNYRTYAYMAISASLGSISAYVILCQSLESVPRSLTERNYLIFSSSILSVEPEPNIPLLGFMTALRRSEVVRERLARDIIAILRSCTL